MRVGPRLAQREWSLHWNGPLLVYSVLIFISIISLGSTHHIVDCNQLLLGQFSCPDPPIDPSTQQISGCRPNNTAPLVCQLQPDSYCAEGSGLNSTHFLMEIPCEYTSGYSFEISLLLSIFLGMFGLDRLYLGYPALALAKFCTLGGMFLWQLIDIILIAMQVVRPADGSQYVISYYGQKLTRLTMDNDTQLVVMDDW